MTTAILLAFCVGSFAMWLLMRERTRTAEDAADRSQALADHYRSSYLAAISARPPVPVSDPTWIEFLGEQWTP
jgi:hypothetical protein